jgi:hypothetical protein
MKRRVLLIDSYYPTFIKSQGLNKVSQTGESYSQLLCKVLDAGFGTGGAYVQGFRDAGWSSDIVIPNSLALQTQWAHENGIPSPWSFGWDYGLHVARLPVVNQKLHKFPHMHRMVLEQVKATRPDVVLVQDLNLFPYGLAQQLKKYCGLLVGEIASPLPPKSFLMSYDLILSALPSIVEKAHSWGLQSQWVPLGFDEKWKNTSTASSRPIDAIFVGSFSRLQKSTAPLLAEAAKLIPGLHIYGTAPQDVLQEWGLEQFHKGPAWGKDMFALLGQSKLVLNRHGEVAGPYAVNMRMFESTGSGALLVTENKTNLSDLFEPGKEVLAYDTPQQAAQLARDVLDDPVRLDSIALAGQTRTLETHTYTVRASQVTEIFENYLRARS